MDTQKGAVVYYVEGINNNGNLVLKRNNLQHTLLIIKPDLGLVTSAGRRIHPLELPGVDVIRYTINKTIVLRLRGRGRPVYLHNGVWSFIRPEKFR